MTRDEHAGKSSSGKNVGDFERMASAVSGAAMLYSGLRSRSGVGIVKAIFGGALVYRGLSGQCSVYKALGVNTANSEKGEAGKPEKGAPARPHVRHSEHFASAE
jgi:uncharacterized membrane protein